MTLTMTLNRTPLQKFLLHKKVWLCALTLLFAVSAVQAQQATEAEAKHVPVIDAAAGPCSVEFTVTDPKGKPVYAATIDVHVAYGFMGAHRLDLEVGTNIDGKARFAGLPVKVKGGTLYFTVLQGELSGSSFYNPAKSCDAKQGIFLTKSPQ